MWYIEEHVRVDRQLLGIRYRMIYRVVAARHVFQVLAVTAHDYRRRG